VILNTYFPCQSPGARGRQLQSAGRAFPVRRHRARGGRKSAQSTFLVKARRLHQHHIRSRNSYRVLSPDAGGRRPPPLCALRHRPQAGVAESCVVHAARRRHRPRQAECSRTRLGRTPTRWRVTRHDPPHRLPHCLPPERSRAGQSGLWQPSAYARGMAGRQPRGGLNGGDARLDGTGRGQRGRRAPNSGWCCVGAGRPYATLVADAESVGGGRGHCGRAHKSLVLPTRGSTRSP